MIFLSKAEYIDINKMVLKQAKSNSFGIQYPQGLDLVVEQPKQVIFGRELYPNIWIKAAFIIQKLTKKHIFMDGNKRTAMISGIVFLDQNGYRLSFSPKDGESFILNITNSQDSEDVMLDVAEWLKNHSKNKMLDK